MRISRPERAALALLLAAGAALRLWQYFANTSLWIDEIALAENVLHMPLFSLVSEPLSLDQVAPPGFLAALKLSTSAFGATELALRLPALVCGLAALLLFAVLALRTRPGWTSVFATGMFAFSSTMIAYSAEAKQYSADVCFSLILTLLALGLARSTPRTGSRFLVAGLVGAVSVWFSAGAVFMLTGLGGGLAALSFRERERGATARLYGMLALWAASAAAAVAVGLRSLSPSTREYMRQFWEPSLPRPTVLALVTIACALLWGMRREASVLLIGPVIATLAAAAAGQYPFSGRAILFLMPVAVLAAADGVGLLVEGLVRLRVPRWIGAGVLVSLAAVIAWKTPVYRREEARPILASLAATRKPGDVLYVYYGAERAVRFYGPRAGIDPSEATFGACHRGQPREYLRELDRFRGLPRVWLVFSHASRAERSTISGYLGAIGRRRRSFEAAGAAAELYDLSDPARLQTSTAETYPVSEDAPDSATRYGCGHGGLAAAPPDWK